MESVCHFINPLSTIMDNSIVFNPTRAIQKILNFFVFVGIWQTNYKFRVVYMIYGMIFQFTFSYAYTGFQFVNLFVATDVNVITEQIFIVLAMISHCIRMTNFVRNFKEMEGFLVVIRNFKVLNQMELELYRARLSRFVFIMVFYLCCGLFAVSFSNCAPLFDTVMRLPYPGWYPLDWSNLFPNSIFWIQVNSILFFLPPLAII